MKKHIATLVKVKKELIKAAEKRDATALKRSDAWYESQNGKKYEMATAILADATETVNQAIEELETFLKTAS